MRKKINKSEFLTTILFLILVVYVISIFITQQKTLNSYKNEQKYISEQINQQDEYKQSLIAMKDNVNSPEYIEEIAREKLEMYLPNERVYIDIGE